MRCRIPSVFLALVTLLAFAIGGCGCSHSASSTTPASSAAASAPVFGNPHIWLDPRIQIQASQIIRDALMDLDPAGKATFEKNVQKCIDDLNQLDQDFAAAAAGLKNRDFIGIRRVETGLSGDGARLFEKNTGAREFILQPGNLQDVV